MPSHQSRLLAPARALLGAAAADAGLGALDVVEAAAARLGGFDLDGYAEAVGAPRRGGPGLAYAWADKVLAALAATPVPPRLALAALAQPRIDRATTRTTGAYYTDFRLAAYLAARVLALPGRPLTPASAVLDTASGTGILLAALVAAIAGGDPGAATALVRDGVCAVDVDPAALRGTAAVLASFTGDLGAVRELTQRLVAADSLLAPEDLWRRLAPGGFDAVIGNPPWERLRSTRHETLQAAGVVRHYGDEYAPGEAAPFDGNPRRYAEAVVARYPRFGGREVDLYQPFVSLGLRLCAGGGRLGLLVPAGLIRSQGTQALRAQLLAAAPAVDLTVLHNRAGFFGIDTRVKFLALAAIGAGAPGPRLPLRLRHAGADGTAVVQTAATAMDRLDLAAARPDLGVPEVRGDAEWRLFRRMSAAGVRPADPAGPWAMSIVREVDMTGDRHLFVRDGTAGALPVVEGRMVHQHRSRAKSYVTGTGRAARWDSLAVRDAGGARSQFFVRAQDLSPVRLRRAATPRVGFCDIVGQTNERTLQAALIGAGRVCGNKVPTVDLLAHRDDPDRPFVLVAVLNSLPVDWLLRRVVTTSLNYFVLLGLPLPRVEPGSAAAARLAALARALHGAEGDPRADLAEMASWRAQIDVLVLRGYGLDAADAGLLLDDFPLLDRGQPPLPGETRSTVTRDLLLATLDPDHPDAASRHAAAAGAVAYVPNV